MVNGAKEIIFSISELFSTFRELFGAFMFSCIYVEKKEKFPALDRKHRLLRIRPTINALGHIPVIMYFKVSPTQ